MERKESEKYARLANEVPDGKLRDEYLGKWFNASKKEGRKWFLGQPMITPTGQFNMEFFVRLGLIILFIPIFISFFICKLIPLKGFLKILKIPIFLVILLFEIILIVFLIIGFSSGDFKGTLLEMIGFIQTEFSKL